MKTSAMKSNMTREEAGEQILEACRRLYARNMLAAADGNVSVRLSDDEILITPSGRPKGFISARDLAVIALDGRVVSGKPSMEREMHLAIYRRCPAAVSVVHAHPPHAIAWSLAKPSLKELPTEHLGEVILGTGGIPIVPYARPTTEAMGSSLEEFLPKSRAMILARHGAVCWGEDLTEAMNGMERVEHSAQILWLAEQLGGSKPLPSEEVDILRAMRAQMGDRLL
jgi:L-fuculose-phosphate aldolase